MTTTACITGVSGYIGSHLAAALIERNYNTRGTVKDLNDPKKVAPLQKVLPKLKFYEANLVKEGSFKEAFEGCDLVFHVASPVPWFTTVLDINVQAELVDPAIKGTINVLKTAMEVGTVKKVVLTSSVAAVASRYPNPAHVYTESDWNLESQVDTEPYRFAKRSAEQAAWKFVEENNHPFKLVVINPSMAIGPLIYPRNDATAIKTVERFLNGEFYAQGCPPISHALIDVRDIAKVEILLAENPDSEGRNIISATEIGYSFLDLSKFLKDDFANYPLPEREYAEATPRIKLSTKKAQEKLHILPSFYIDPKQSMIDMANSLIHFGFVTKQQ